MISNFGKQSSLLAAIICFFIYFNLAKTFQHQTISTHDIIAGDTFFEITDPPELEYTYRLRPAKDFGTTFLKRFQNVPLIITKPPLACTQILNARELKGNIAFIDRGECSFLTKTINAELAGAVAAIITEFDNTSHEFEFYIQMVHDNTDRETHIPAGFLLGKNALVIRSTLMRLKKPHAFLNIPLNLTFTPPAKINHPPWLGW